MRARIWKVRCVVIREWHVFAPTYPQLLDLLRKLPMLELASEKHAEKTYNDKECRVWRGNVLLYEHQRRNLHNCVVSRECCISESQSIWNQVVGSGRARQD